MYIIQEFGLQPYLKIWQDMLNFTMQRRPDTLDEIWILEHEPVYTQGQAGKAEHILQHNHIPIIQSDRGGQITYHGPGQLIVYFLLDCKKNQLGVKQLVHAIENLCIQVLKSFQIHSETKCGAPGVYVNHQKIASLGLRIKNHCSYHGLAININMDLSPFSSINPCGYQAMQMTQMIEHHPEICVPEVIHAVKLALHDFFQFTAQGKNSCSI